MSKIRYILLLLCSLFFVQCLWNESELEPSYLPLDDSEYPYADLPRLVIETVDFQQIRNKETEVPAYLQIYGKDLPESDVKYLTIKGRGNSSFEMTKYGYKLEFENKESLFGMPRNRDWALIAIFRDKSFLHNYITYMLADLLGDAYAPRSCFVELYLNRQYMGLYQLTESVKVDKNRVNIPKNDSSFLFERTTTSSLEKDHFYSSFNHLFQIKSPKNVSADSKALLTNHINSFEAFLMTNSATNLDSLANWIDIQDFARYFLIQEFSKNIDGNWRSIFLTWQKNSVIQMGPVWDFDMAYGLSSKEKISPEGWNIRTHGWNQYLFKGSQYRAFVRQFWDAHHSTFESLIDSINAIYPHLEKVSKNEFKRWPVLKEEYIWPFIESMDSYTAAVDSLKSWIARRIQWMDGSL